jgi:hypothetical protein
MSYSKCQHSKQGPLKRVRPFVSSCLTLSLCFAAYFGVSDHLTPPYQRQRNCTRSFTYQRLLIPWESRDLGASRGRHSYVMHQ